MTTILVTGGAGFIGSHLCESLVEEDCDVVAIDDLSSGRRANVDDLLEEPRFDLARADILDGLRDGLDGSTVEPDDVDAVYHLASRASPTEYRRHPLSVALANTEGTRAVLEFAQDVDARVVFASTSEVYGKPERHPQHESYNGNVDPQGPRACYKESKRFGETLAAIYREERGVDARVARIFNTYGPRMRSDDGRVIPTFVSQALENRPITVHGDGRQTRSFLYISDLIRGLQALMDRDDPIDRPVNLGSTSEVAIEALAETVIDIVDTDSEIQYEERPVGDADRRCPDVTRARRHLDWEPRVTLREGLKRIERVRDSRG